MAKVVEVVRPLVGGTGGAWHYPNEEPTPGDYLFCFAEPTKRIFAARYEGMGVYSVYPSGQAYAGPVYWQRAGSSLHFLDHARARNGAELEGFTK